MSFWSHKKPADRITHAVDITDDRRDTGQTRPPARNDADVFVCVLADLVLPVLVVVQVGYGLTQL